MDDRTWLAERFEAERPRLRGLAYRMLGSLAEAEDAVQEAWLRLGPADAPGNLAGWLTTVVARICLDTLRSRKSRPEAPLEAAEQEPAPGADPEREAEIAEQVGLAVLVVLETLAPAERVAFVLHDMFGLSFDEIGRVVGRSTPATRQLASRARRRLQGGARPAAGSLARKRKLVDAFLAAARGGDFPALLALLDPDVVLSADAAALARVGASDAIRGAGAVAGFFSGRAEAARAALVDGDIGVVVAPGGRLLAVLGVTIRAGRIAAIEAIGDPQRLASLDISALDGASPSRV